MAVLLLIDGTASFADLGRGLLVSGASSDAFSAAQAGSFAEALAASADQQYFRSSTADYVVIRAARQRHK